MEGDAGRAPETDSMKPAKQNRAPRCQRRPTEADFACFPIGTRVSVYWGVSGRLSGEVIGRTRYRLRVRLDKWQGVTRRTTPSPLTVRLLTD